MITLETRVDFHEPMETANEQTRADQGNEGECNFGDGEQAAEFLSAGTRSSRSFFQNAVQILFQNQDCRNQTADDSRKKAHGKRKSQYPTVESGFLYACEIRWNERAEDTKTGASQNNSQYAAKDREHNALCKQLRKQTRAAGTQSDAKRDLFLPNRVPRQKQIHDVGASHQEHKSHGSEENQQRHAHLYGRRIFHRKHQHTPILVRVRKGLLFLTIQGHKLGLCF